MIIQEQSPLNIEGLEAYQTKIFETSPAWLKALRQRSFSQFLEFGLPTIKEEEFKYTSLAQLSGRAFQLPLHHKLVEDNQFNAYVNQADINVVLVNGVLWGNLSNLKHLPNGLKITSFNEAAAHFPTEVEATVAKWTSNDHKSLVNLNHALFLDGAFIKVDDGAVIEPLVHIIHVTSAPEENTIVFPRTLIHVGQGAQISILESHIGFSPNVYLSNAVCDMRVGESSNVRYCKAEGEAHHAIHIASTRIWQERSSSFEGFSFAHKAQLTRNNLSILLKGEGTNTIMNGLYAIDGNQHVDNHTLLDIQHPNCTSYQLYKGLLNGSSRAVFNGKIYVHADAQKTNGYQLNKHLLLGKDARIDTKPQLEIFADDVKCTHGATIGQLNEEEIFYLQSRAINKQTAVLLMAKGFIDDIVNTIKDESVRCKLIKLMAAKYPEVKL